MPPLPPHPSLLRRSLLSLPILVPLFAAAAPAQVLAEFRFAREGVLGSSSSLVVAAPDEATANRVQAAVHAEVARLEAVLSTWDESSELLRLTKAGTGTASPDLLAVLRAADRWRTASHGAFEPGIATLTTLWLAAEKRGAAPTDAELAAAVAALKAPAWQITGDRVTVRAPFTLDAIAKGHIVELAGRMAEQVPGTQCRSFQIGGDMRIGKPAQRVAFVDPRHPATNGAPLLTVSVADAAVASSGGYARGFDLAGGHRSHILDPRTGKPCDGVLGASVIAKDCATADALATILCVLGPDEGLRFLATVPGAEGVVVTADGTVHESPGLRQFVVADTPAAAPVASAWPAEFALQIEFAIKPPAAAGGRQRGGWKRPYVAVWIEDVTGAPARTLCLWIEDRRWLRDLRRWSRQHADTPRLVDLVSQATRKAGSYTLTWDGTDDEGRTLAPGRYTVLIEAVREHGSYQLLRQDVELGSKPLNVDLEGNAEIEHGRIVFGKPARKDGKQ